VCCIFVLTVTVFLACYVYIYCFCPDIHTARMEMDARTVQVKKKQRKPRGTHVPHGLASTDLCFARLVDRERAFGFISRPQPSPLACFVGSARGRAPEAGRSRPAREEGPARARHGRHAAGRPTPAAASERGMHVLLGRRCWVLRQREIRRHEHIQYSTTVHAITACDVAPSLCLPSRRSSLAAWGRGSSASGVGSRSEHLQRPSTSRGWIGTRVKGVDLTAYYFL